MTKKLLLRILLLTAFAFTLFPISMILSAWSGTSHALAIMITNGFCLLLWFGAWLTLCFQKISRKRKRRTTLLFSILAIVILLGCSFFLPYSLSSQRVICGLVAGGSFFAGTRLIFQPLERLTNSYVFTGICLWFVALGLIWRRMDESASTWPILILLGIHAILFAIANNMHALEQTLHDRDQRVWKIPQEIRHSNNRLMCVLVLLGVVLLLCYKPLAKFMRWLGRWILTGLWYLLRWLFSLGGSTSETSDAPEVISEQVETVAENTTADWIWLIVELTICVGLFVLVIWKRKEIIAAMQNLWWRLRAWFLEKLHQEPTVPPEKTTAYYDYVEDLLAEDMSIEVAKGKITKRQWKRAYRQYLHMPKDAKRYRLGYALILARLPKEVAKESWSSREILEELKRRGIADARWETITDVYDAVRYGERSPERFAQLDAILEASARGD